MLVASPTVKRCGATPHAGQGCGDAAGQGGSAGALPLAGCAPKRPGGGTVPQPTTTLRYNCRGEDAAAETVRSSEMATLWNTAQPLCTRCQVHLRLKGQRWCRQCL